MEQRLANTWQVTVNEKKFIEAALHSDLRVDGRRSFDYRRLTVKFGRVDGSSEVQLGQTHVMGFVTSQLVQPYQERSNEGTFAIYTEFSPMADPSFEPGRPGEYAVELGRIIDRGLRESRAIDMESLCVIAGKLVWAIRIDLHILDNGGNLVDASNIAALAALLTFRRPECTLEGEDGHEVRVHPPEVREPIPLIIHHLPIAVTFGFIGHENHVIVDPTHLEETVLEGKLTATVNTSGDICAIQKPGGVGVMHSVVTQCLRIASVKAADITSKIQKAVEGCNTERALRKVKRHPTSLSTGINGSYSKTESSKQSLGPNTENDAWSCQMERLKLTPSSSSAHERKDTEKHVNSTENIGRNGRNKLFKGGPSSWDPYMGGKSTDVSKSSLNSLEEMGERRVGEDMENEEEVGRRVVEGDGDHGVKEENEVVGVTQPGEPKTLKDAVKPKNKRKKRGSLPPSPMDLAR